MAETFRFELVSPERLLVSEDIASVTAPGAEGEFTVLPRHAPFMTTLKPGVLTVRVDKGPERRIVVFGGFAEVNPDGCIVLAEEAVPVDALDPEAVAREIRDAEEDVADAETEEARFRAQTRLDQLRALQQALA
jgi:F-type H+-transporting ATPase subunit epsilon